MDLIIEEFKELVIEEKEKEDDQCKVVLFGLHKEKTANVFTKWKLLENEIQIDEKYEKDMLKWIDETTPDLTKEDFKYNTNRHRYLERHMRKFVGSLYIPTYNKVTNYNFHDTLECLIKRMFEDEVKEKYKKIKLMEDNQEDLILPGTTEFYKLPLQ